MKYKIISMDFDGTLLTSDKKISQRNKDILLKYKNNGCIIVGITARNFTSVNSVCNIDMFDYLILNNGAYIYNVKDNVGTDINYIDKQIAIEITNYFKNFAIEIDYCSLHKYYMYKKGMLEEKDYIVRINSIDEVKEKISRINIFINNYEKIDDYKKYIENNFNSVSAFIMSDTDNNSDKKWIAINPKNINKFNGLNELCLKLKINLNEVMFFGDSANDLSIISRVGLGVAMGNALKEVREQAKEITLSNDEDGIAEFLKNRIIKK